MKNIPKRDIEKAFADGKIPFKCTRLTDGKVKYTLASSEEQCQKKFFGWKLEVIDLREFSKHRQENKIIAFFKDVYGFGKELVSLIVNS